MTFAERTIRLIALVAITLFLLGNLLNALHKEDDFDVYREAGRRLVADESLYAGSGVGTGFIGPPAQALLFAPLAALPPVASQLAWYAINVALLIYAVMTWLRVLLAPEHERPAWHDWRAQARYLFAPASLLSLLAIVRPLQTQFEHQNLNIVLLALAAAAADALTRDRAALAGGWLGVATAIKVYPGLALPWLALRRQGTALGSAIATTLLVSLAPAAISGFTLLRRYMIDWSTVAAIGWPTRRANQSFIAMWGRYLLGETDNAYPVINSTASAVLVMAALTAVVTLAPIVLASTRRLTNKRALAEELACVSAIAVLISPIAWEHYWVAFFPVFVALGRRAFDDRNRWAAAAFWIGLIGISGLSRPTTGWEGIRVIRAWSVMTWSGMVMCIVLALLLIRDARTASAQSASNIDK
jgi:alpha-1,2-mannosyltransferase